MLQPVFLDTENTYMYLRSHLYSIMLAMHC